MNIQYKNNALVISIPCADPAAMHELLMQSIISTVGYSSAVSDKSKRYADEIIPLLNLLKQLMPDELQLKKIQ